ncbi:MAG: EAL domain-containing protein [Anaerovoracaceae bacterium]
MAESIEREKQRKSVLAYLRKATTMLTITDPKNIGIEITESVFASDYDSINSIIEDLKESGLYIAIDDFGTGYSSLSREKELKADCMKIDKYFVDRLIDTDLNKTITGDIISMAHKLGHYTIAEGVENETQLQYLKEYGCDKIQGYLISKPLTENEALEFLKIHDKNMATSRS